MVGPCILQVEFTNVTDGGFVEVALILINTETNVIIGRKVERVFPNTTLQVGPFRCNLRFADAELSCPLELYVKDFNGDPKQDFRPEDMDTLFMGDDTLKGAQFLP